MADIGKGTVGIGFDQAAISGALAGLSARLIPGLGAIGSRGGKALTAGLVLGLAGIGVAVVGGIRAFARFDDAMTKSLAIMDDISGPMRKKMETAAREVGKTTVFSATEAAEAYFFLASAGLNAEEAVAALPAVASFAQAGMFDLSKATDLLTDAQSALGLKTGDATQDLENMVRVSDVLVGANQLANASVEQFATALTSKAGAALKVHNIDVEQGVAVLAAFADQGLKGAAAGEGLAVILRDVTRAAARNKDEFAELGIEVFDAEGNLKDLDEVVRQFEVALDGMSDSEIAATLETLGLTRSVGDMLKLLLGSSDDIAAYEDSLRDAGGATQEVADKNVDSLKGQLDLLKGKFEDVAISIGEQLEPKLKTAVEWMNNNSDTIKQILIPALALLGAALLVLAGKAIIAFIAFLGIPGLIIAALIAAAILIITHWDTIVSAVQTAIDAIWGFVSERWPLILAALTGPLGIVVGLIITHWNTITSAITGALRTIWSAITGTIDAVLGFVRDKWGLLVAIMLGPVVLIVRLITQHFGKIPGIVRAALNLAVNIVRTAWNTAFAVTRSVVSSIIGFVRGIPGRVRGALSSLQNILASTARNAWSAFLRATRSVAQTVLGFIRRLPGLIVNALAGLPGRMYSIGRDAIQGLINGLKSLNPASVMKDVAGGVVNFGKSVLGIGSPSKVFHQIGIDVGRGLMLGLDDSARGVMRSAESLAAATIPTVNVSPMVADRSQPVLELHADGDREFLRWLRKTVRFQGGGDVQVALGQR